MNPFTGILVGIFLVLLGVILDIYSGKNNIKITLAFLIFSEISLGIAIWISTFLIVIKN